MYIVFSPTPKQCQALFTCGLVHTPLRREPMCGFTSSSHHRGDSLCL